MEPSICVIKMLINACAIVNTWHENELHKPYRPHRLHKRIQRAVPWNWAPHALCASTPSHHVAAVDVPVQSGRCPYWSQCWHSVRRWIHPLAHKHIVFRHRSSLSSAENSAFALWNCVRRPDFAEMKWQWSPGKRCQLINALFIQRTVTSVASALTADSRTLGRPADGGSGGGNGGGTFICTDVSPVSVLLSGCIFNSTFRWIL